MFKFEQDAKNYKGSVRESKFYDVKYISYRLSCIDRFKS